MVTEFSGLAESSVFVVQNFSKEFQNLKKMGELKLGEDGLIKVESETKKRRRLNENERMRLIKCR
jgi:hypothetical protein